MLKMRGASENFVCDIIPKHLNHYFLSVSKEAKQNSDTNYIKKTSKIIISDNETITRHLPFTVNILSIMYHKKTNNNW